MGVLVASHGNLAGALLRTAESIAGECPYAWAVELGMDEAPEAFRERLLAAMRRTDKGAPDEWLLLTDLLGGTPHRVAAMLCDGLPRHERCAVVSGVNLAMVVDALLACQEASDAASLALHVASTGLQQVRGAVRDDLAE